MKSKWTKWIGAWCLLLTACGAGAAEAKPNTLWITGEDMSAKWLGCYGNQQIKTPNFDRLASEGFRYTGCCENSPGDTRGRAALCETRSRLRQGCRRASRGAD